MSKPNIVPIEGYQGLGDPQRLERMRRERQKEKEEFEAKKAALESESSKKKVQSISSKFDSSRSMVIDQKFTDLTTGLVTVSEFKRKRENIQELHEESIDKERKLRDTAMELARQRRMDALHNKAKGSSKLSFNVSDEGEDSEGGSTSGVDSDRPESLQKKKLSKNPTVDTSFLPDRQREEEEKRERERLKKEWQEKVAKMKAEKLEITYSYWDGTGHRRQITVTKGHTIERFLEDVRKSLQEEFRELRGVPVDNLMYIKEDLIMPHHLTFHDLIISKARGKSGPLFHFDVHEDVRLQSDARIEKDESHAGKVVERHWYERNKHIFPASRWEPYDPNKSFIRYSIKDSIKDTPYLKDD